VNHVRSRASGLAVVLLLVTLCGVPVRAAAADATVGGFSPQGTVKDVRQAAARFSEPMVAFGDPRGAPDPFVVQCPEPGTGRWVDPRQWVYDFTRDLPGGLRCTFQLRPGLQTLDGRPVTAPAAFTFTTGGPSIRDSTPRAGSEWIEEEQAFLLVLDAAPTPESLERHVGFNVEGLPQRVGARVLTGRIRDAVIRTRYSRSSLPGPLVMVLQPRQRLPNGARVSLVWGKDVASAGGVASAQDQVLQFKVRPPFTASFECERERRDAGCVPVSAMRVRFSAPVALADARRVVLRGPGGQSWAPALDRASASHVDGLSFKPPVPESAALTLELPGDLRDESGRSLGNAGRFPLAVRTEAFPPLAKFPARFGIVERNAEPALPVTLRNLEPELRARMAVVPGGPRGFGEQVRGRVFRIPPERSAAEILGWIRRVSTADREASLFGATDGAPAPTAFNLPKPNGPQPMEVVGIPLREAGFYVVELESPRLGAALLGKAKPMYVPAAALVTNLSVHLKWGRESSLVWVTALDSGRPVPGARVAVHDCTGKELWRGSADSDGIARVPALPAAADLARCKEPPGKPWAETFGNFAGGLFVTAQTPDDLSFVHSSWDQGIEPWRWQFPTDGEDSALTAHTILDRPLFRAGETVHMKHLLRLGTQRGLALVPPDRRPTKLVIRHLGSDESYDLPLTWDAASVAEHAWPIPAGAKLGSYAITMERPAPAARPGRPQGEGQDEDGPRSLTSGGFQVQQFRVPLMRGTLRPPTEPLVAASQFPVDIAVQYLAGGGAGRHPATLRTQVRPRGTPGFDGFEEFVIANGALKEGITRRGAVEDDGDETAPDPSPAAAVHQRQELTLDAAGTTRATVTDLPKAAVPQTVLTELEFRDPNGETQTVSARVPLWPARWLVGIRPQAWAASRESVRAEVVVLDVAGKPVVGAPVAVNVLERKIFSHRKRLVGGFYAYEHVEEVRAVGALCRGVTDARGRLACDSKPPIEGRLVLQAGVTDPEGRSSAAHVEVWVAGSAEWWFEQRESDRIDLLPERRRYEPGETARLQVRMPFRTATALVTVEREGVLDARVVPLSGREPVIELPIQAAWAPNVYVSALVVRGRVGDVQPTALVDLGRPAFKLGLAEVRVGWRAHELKVTVASDRPTYRTRERAQVRVSVRTADGKVPPPGSEVALAAVDEGLLELAANRSWDVLEAMMRPRSYGVGTATAQGHVVGKRHFGRKAVPPGGGGGRATTRELFETLLLWKGRVALDAAGEARVEVPLNDSITSFRIVAVATGGVGLFGTGAATIRATQDLMVLPGIAPVVREGDRVAAEVTVRNATERPMQVHLAGRVTGLAEPLAPRDVTLAPGEARAVGWEVAVPAGLSTLGWEIEAAERGATAGAADRLRVTQRVAPAVPVRVYQATLEQLDRPLRVTVERPVDALSGAGGVAVRLAPTLTEGLTTVRDWMARYPYTCLEQQVSRAVTLRDETRWREIAGELPAFQDGAGLLKYFPTMSQGSEILTAYVLAVSHEAGWALPAEVQTRAEAGLKGFVKGTLRPREPLLTADLSIRKLAAIEALSRFGKAEPELLGSLMIEPTLWPTSAVLDWRNVLHRLRSAPSRAPRLAEAEQILRSRLNVQGTTLGFSTEKSDGLWWLMVSTDGNAARLILHLLETGQWRDEVPRLVRGALGRRRGGHWDLTVANAWATLAVEKFSRAFEATPVAGASTATLAGTARRIEWTAGAKGGQATFPWPARRDDVVVEHAGTGRPWVTVESRAAVPLRAPLSSGYRIGRTLDLVEGARPAEPRAPGQWRRGDLVRVTLTVEAQTDMTWVVVDDPIPAGASHVGSGLARDSSIARAGERQTGQAWPAFQERGFEGFRAYYEYVPKGTFTVQYTLRLNQAGRFQLPTTRVEALYAPEAFGELPNAAIEVLP
jgi:uncharacterized protein YfaS (alpha-2-macroglobulin family)